MSAPDSSPLAGYLGGALLVLMVFSQMGLLVLFLAPAALLLHGLAARRASPFAASHHRFLARTWGYSVAVLVLLYALIALPLWQLLTLVDVAADAVAAADRGRELETVWTSLSAYLRYGGGPSPLWMAVSVILHLGGSFLISAWLAVRLIRRWLRWSERRFA